VKKLAENAQTVFTESPWQQRHINGLPDVEGRSKDKARNQTKNIAFAFDLRPP